MCGFGCGNENGIIWILLLLCLCGNNGNSGCNSCGVADNNWIWIILLLCCCGNNGNQLGNCGSC